jgi:signal-transduction protein with cAMP-binding, CBS, and nucleotidyltransferase domain
MSMTPAEFKEQFPEIAKHCGPGGQDDLLATLEAREVQAGQSVATDGEYSDSLFLVASGKLVSQITSDKETIRLGTVKKGDCFGEVNILDPGPSTSSVIATEDSTVYSLSHDALRKLDKAHPEMTGNILRMLSTIMIDRCRGADKLLFSKYAPIEGVENDKSKQRPGLIEWGRDILQKLHGHRGMQR